jgi:hypothetical protein
MATTTNYSWTTPDDTDLVKDGAAAIRSLGTAIDSTVFTNAGAAINKTIVDAKGDLIVGTAADTVARLASSGVNGEVLQVDTSTATGLKYGAVAAGSNWSLLNAGGTALTGATTITVSGISGKDKILVFVAGASSVNAQSTFTIRYNADSGSNYYTVGALNTYDVTYASSNFSAFEGGSDTSITLGRMSNAVNSRVSGSALLTGCNAAGLKVYQISSGAIQGSSNGPHQTVCVSGYYNSASTISSVSILSSTGNFDAGTVYVYTSA